MDAPGLEDRQPVGFLRRFSYAGVPEKDFLLYPGLNMIGRKSDSAVILPFPFISRLHAFIEISFRTRKPLLSDFGSLNGSSLTRTDISLDPLVNYPLRDKDMVFFANVCCQYHHLGAPQLPGPQGALPFLETPRFPRLEGPQLQGSLLGEEPNNIEGPVEKDQRLNGRDGNSDSDADVSEQKNFDQ
ncbi:mediator of DNA damage checkpoint protein 1-like isoform X1 [Macrotis lagotis]|uniref:mediator of DNA damage checkpoint protein 1-like isoform X1 n=1 Tax=Macrotis lagotis TaxID=92651 RepID=UPI003D6995CE